MYAHSTHPWGSFTKDNRDMWINPCHVVIVYVHARLVYLADAVVFIIHGWNTIQDIQKTLSCEVTPVLRNYLAAAGSRKPAAELKITGSKRSTVDTEIVAQWNVPACQPRKERRIDLQNTPKLPEQLCSDHPDCISPSR